MVALLPYLKKYLPLTDRIVVPFLSDKNGKPITPFAREKDKFVL